MSLPEITKDSLQESGVKTDVFSDEQLDVVLSILKARDAQVEQEIEQRVSDQLEQSGLSVDRAEVMRMKYGMKRRHLRDFDKRFIKNLEIWRNNGYDPEDPEVRFSYKDLARADAARLQAFREGKIKDTEFVDTQFSTDQPLLLPKVVSQVVREAIEPRIVLQDLLQRLSFQNGQQITFPAMSAMRAGDVDEGGEYPTGRLEFAGQVTATLGKSGIGVMMTEEMIRYSMFDVMTMHLRAAGRALIRHKEKKVANLISAQGTTLFDNVTAGQTRTTGRGIDGNFNGTLHIDDLFTAYADLADAGFVANTLIMHPFGWLIFARDQQLRHFGFFRNGPMFQTYQGNLGNAPEWSLGGLNQQSYVSAPEALAGTYSNVPNAFPAGLRIIVSPFVPYNAATNTTDIWMCDVNELGILVVDEEVTTDEWMDSARDIHHVKLRERYGLALLNNGQAVRQIKGVYIGKNYPIEELGTWELGTGTPPTGFTLGG
jgi:hypothetical protein